MTASKHVLGSDFDTIDAHEIASAEYDELPELTDDWFANAWKRGPVKTAERMPEPLKDRQTGRRQ